MTRLEVEVGKAKAEAISQYLNKIKSLKNENQALAEQNKKTKAEAESIGAVKIKVEENEAIKSEKEVLTAQIQILTGEKKALQKENSSLTEEVGGGHVEQRRIRRRGDSESRELSPKTEAGESTGSREGERARENEDGVDRKRVKQEGC